MPEDSNSWDTIASARRKDALDHWWPQWNRHAETWNYYRGKIFTPDEKRRAKADKKALLEFNDFPTIINSSTGKERVNRFRAALKGRDTGKNKDPELLEALFSEFGIDESIDDPRVAQAFTEVFRWIEQGCDADDEISDAFMDAFLCGVGNTETRFDPLAGKNGKIKTEELKAWQVAWDPNATKRNMKDSSHVFSFVWVDLAVAKRMFPKKIDVLISQADDSSNQFDPISRNDGNTRPYYQQVGTNPGIFYQKATQQVLLTRYEVKSASPQVRFADPEDESDRLVSEDEWKEINKDWEERGIAGPGEDEIDRPQQWVWEQGWLAGETALTDELEPNAIQDFQVSAITCYPHKTLTGTVWFGVGDLGKDPARWRSKMLSLAVDIIASGSKAPVYLERGAAEDPEEFRKEATRPDGMPILRAGGAEKMKFGPQPANPMSSMGSIIDLAGGEIWSNMGLNPVSAGMVDDPRRAPFQTVNALMQANQSVYAMPFDALSFYRKGLARKYLLFVKGFVEPVTILRAVGVDHARSILESGLMTKDELTGEWIWDEEKFDQMLEFDVVTDDVPSTPSQILAVFQVLTQTDMFTTLQAAGLQPPIDVIIDSFVAMGLPSTAGDKWAQSITDGMTPEQKQLAYQQIISQLSPELQQAIEAELQAPQGAEPPTQGAAN